MALTAELAANAAAAIFGLAVATVPSILLGWALSGFMVLVGEIGLPGVTLRLITPYPAVAAAISL